MPKSLVLDEKTKRDLNTFLRAHGYNFPLGDWLGQFNGLLEKLDNDEGTGDTDYKATLGTDE
jgi:hypothetical protein